MPSHVKEIAGSLTHLQQPVEMLGKYQLMPAERLGQIQSPGTMAIGAAELRNANSARPLYALICQKEAPPRSDIIRLLVRVNLRCMVTPVASGTVVFPEDGVRRYVIVLEQPQGRRLVNSAEEKVPKLDEDALLNNVIRNILPAIHEHTNRALPHRAIRPDNIFIGNDKRVILGECVSAPAAYAQPVLYEPIDSGMVNPSGRGMGSIQDDFYSLGVLLADLAMGGTLLHGKSDDEIIEKKITLGSYGALVGHSRVPLKLMEPLRGLLCDDPAERWGLSDLELWANGRHLSPKQVTLPPKAVRSIAFGGKEYLTAPALANAMRRDWDASKELIKKETLASWVKRSLSDDMMSDKIKSAVIQSQAFASTGHATDRSISLSLMSLNPNGPIHYRDVSVRVDAIAQSLAIESASPNKLQAFAQIIDLKLANAWAQAQPRLKPEFVMILKRIESLEQFMRNQVPGYGIERCIYNGNEGWPCLSPLLGDNYVDHPKDILPALESMVAAGRIEGAPVDLHVLAFCVDKMRGNHDKLLKRFSDPFNRVQYNKAAIKFLSDLQRAHGPKNLPALTKHMAELLSDSVDAFHNTEFRRQLRSAVEKAKDEGSLLKLQSLLDNDHILKQDELGYQQARTMYAQLDKQAAWLEKGGLTSKQNINQVSQKTASAISAVLSGVTLVLMTVNWVL